METGAGADRGSNVARLQVLAAQRESVCALPESVCQQPDAAVTTCGVYVQLLCGHAIHRACASTAAAAPPRAGGGVFHCHKCDTDVVGVVVARDDGGHVTVTTVTGGATCSACATECYESDCEIATYRCASCPAGAVPMLLCNHHAASHSKAKATRGHEVAPLGGGDRWSIVTSLHLPPSLRWTACDVHPSHRADRYCHTCHRVVCVICMDSMGTGDTCDSHHVTPLAGGLHVSALKATLGAAHTAAAATLAAIQDDLDSRKNLKCWISMSVEQVLLALTAIVQQLPTDAALTATAAAAPGALTKEDGDEDPIVRETDRRIQARLHIAARVWEAHQAQQDERWLRLRAADLVAAQLLEGHADVLAALADSVCNYINNLCGPMSGALAPAQAGAEADAQPSACTLKVRIRPPSSAVTTSIVAAPAVYDGGNGGGEGGGAESRDDDSSDDMRVPSPSRNAIKRRRRVRIPSSGTLDEDDDETDMRLDATGTLERAVLRPQPAAVPTHRKRHDAQRSLTSAALWPEGGRRLAAHGPACTVQLDTCAPDAMMVHIPHRCVVTVYADARQPALPRRLQTGGDNVCAFLVAAAAEHQDRAAAEPAESAAAAAQLPLTTVDHEDGTYSVWCTLPALGRYALHVHVNGSAVAQSPWSLCAVAHHHLAYTSQAADDDGRGQYDGRGLFAWMTAHTPGPRASSSPSSMVRQTRGGGNSRRSANAHDQETVYVHLSDEKNCRPASRFVAGHAPELGDQLFTNDMEMSWMAVALVGMITGSGDAKSHRLQRVPVRVRPTGYILSTDGSGVGGLFLLRHWVLQGSEDGLTWTTLRSHRNDATLTPTHTSAYWPIEGATAFYTHVRVLQTGLNSSGNHVLAATSLELYGDVSVDPSPM
jgi:hypothetical protein